MPFSSRLAFDSRTQPWKRRLGLLAFVTSYYAFHAIILALALPAWGGLSRVMLFSECVGLVTVGTSLLLQKIRWIRTLNAVLALIMTTAVSVPVGFVAGHNVAFWLMGAPAGDPSGLGNGHFIPHLELLWSSYTAALASVFILYFLWARQQLALEANVRSSAEQHAAEARRLSAESELRLLRTQIEPHMLFNTLANLRSFVEDDPKKAQLMIDQLITYLRASLSASRTDSTTLRQEFGQLRAYLEIMALRMGERLTYELTLPETLRQIAVPPMLMQPLVENAIKHGLEPKIGGGWIHVRALQTPTAIELSVTDSGLGLPSEDDPAAPHGNAQSYGLVHVRERLQAVYGSKAALSLDSHLPHGTCATIRIVS